MLRLRATPARIYIIACAARLSDQLGKDLPGQVCRAGAFAPVAQ